MDNINQLLNKLQSNIEILVEALKKEKTVSLVNNDIFKSISDDIKELEKYDNKDLKEMFAYYRFTLSHLNNTFSNKEYIDQTDIDIVLGCLNDIKKLSNMLNINLPYNRFISDLKSVHRSLKTINIDSELTYNYISKDILKNYENIIIKYRSLMSKINQIRPYMNSADFADLKLDLEINYAGLKANLNEIYIEILKSNSDIAEPIMNKLMYYVNNENYDSVLGVSMINKKIDDYQRRYELSNNLDILIESLNVIINRYEFSGIDKSNNIVDVDYVDNNQSSNDQDIPPFIEDNYDEHNSKLNSDDMDITYDKKVATFIARFERLRRKLDRKKSLTKEEVKLFNKLESELDILKSNNSNRFISSIRFNHYYKALNKKLIVARKNNFKNIANGNKKRK